MSTHKALLLLSMLIIMAGCAKQPASGPEPPVAPASAMDTKPLPPSGQPSESDKIKITAYINVTSGCQAETVELVDRLGMDYADLIDMEMVDFGSPEGEQRWRSDGMDCMGILFNDSPVLKFPGEDGKPKTVVFFMPAGFNWTHDDLKQAFAAMKTGDLEILTEEQARQELVPKPVEIHTHVRDVDGHGELQINGTPILTVKAEADGKTPIQRAQAAKAAIDEWTKDPVHPSQLSIAAKATGEGKGGPTILAKDIKIIQITKQDAKDAGVETPKQLANEWLKPLKTSIVGAVREAQQTEPTSPPPDTSN